MATAPARTRPGHLARREALIGYVFISPWLIGFLVFLAGPILASLGLSFTQYKPGQIPIWVGLANYVRMFGDELFYLSLSVTTKYTLISVPLGLAIALGLALLLNQKVPGQRFFRTVFYVPSLISGVAMAIVFAWIFNSRFGILNYLLSFLKLDGPNWLSDPDFTLSAFVLMSLWGVGSTVVIFIAALQGVPVALYEAASLDGAVGWRRFIHITLPMISPVVLFAAITGVIGTFQTFAVSYIMTSGGPANASLFYLLYLYKNAFNWFEMGYASALAWFLFLIILICTGLLLRTSDLWVHYEGLGKK
ncbi:MAG: sugar ABC transporter permease [Chloroflexi bacterium]|nr:sugar ABC transporter permease [Chloroflexota bacterium]